MSKKTKIGIISRSFRNDPYFIACNRFDNLEVVACCDNYDLADIERRGQRFGVPVLTVEELLAHPEIEIVVNATHTKAHAAFALAAIAAGKSVYNRAPFVALAGEGPRIVSFAREKRVLVGSDPDTFLSDGIQRCRTLIAEGSIGQPLSVTAFMVQRNVQGWHADPDFYYPYAAGALYNIGSYCLTTLVYLLGRIRCVIGSQSVRPLEQYDDQSGTIALKDIPTHAAGILEFANGISGTLVTSFEKGNSSYSLVEIYGTEGVFRLPDPMSFDTNVHFRKEATQDWRPIDIPVGSLPQYHGIGLADMAEALRENRPHHANGEIASHVIDIISSIQKSAENGKPIRVKSASLSETVADS
jgi:predicted dehydrogenase